MIDRARFWLGLLIFALGALVGLVALGLLWLGTIVGGILFEWGD